MQILLRPDNGDDHRHVIRLDIIDNGVGIDQGRLDRRAEGHLGLRLLRDRLTEQGGSITFTAGPEGGTAVRAVLPAAGRPHPGHKYPSS